MVSLSAQDFEKATEKLSKQLDIERSNAWFPYDRFDRRETCSAIAANRSDHMETPWSGTAVIVSTAIAAIAEIEKFLSRRS